MYKTNISYQCQLCSVSIWPSLILFHLDYTACRVTCRHLHNANSAFANSSDAFNKPFCFCSSLCTQWLNKSIVNLLKIKDWVILFQSWYSSLCTWLKHLRQKCQPQVFQKKKKTFCDTISWIFELTRAELGVSVHSNFYCRSPRRCFYWVGSTFLLGHSRTFTELSWSHSCVFLAAHWNRNLCHSLTPGACLKRFSLKPPSIFFGSPCHRNRIPMLGMMLLCLNVKVILLWWCSVPGFHKKHLQCYW